ncbi:TPA: hypothetical protein HA317_02230 [Candidatus Woesearchaeota archaeon]|nr:hypothetical protein [Candidatus Woesearchaeota archaeon]
MPKCQICKKKLEETFLNKIVGTVVRDNKGKKHVICSECQGKLRDKEKMLEKL